MLPRFHSKFWVPLHAWFNDLVKTAHTLTLNERWRFFIYSSLSPFRHTLISFPFSAYLNKDGFELRMTVGAGKFEHVVGEGEKIEEQELSRDRH